MAKEISGLAGSPALDTAVSATAGHVDSSTFSYQFGKSPERILRSTAGRAARTAQPDALAGHRCRLRRRTAT